MSLVQSGPGLATLEAVLTLPSTGGAGVHLFQSQFLGGQCPCPFLRSLSQTLDMPSGPWGLSVIPVLHWGMRERQPISWAYTKLAVTGGSVEGTSELINQFKCFHLENMKRNLGKYYPSEVIKVNIGKCHQRYIQHHVVPDTVL